MMGCEAGWCKTSTPLEIFIMTPSLEGWSNKAKEASSPNKVRLALLDTNPNMSQMNESVIDLDLKTPPP